MTRRRREGSAPHELYDDRPDLNNPRRTAAEEFVLANPPLPGTTHAHQAKPTPNVKPGDTVELRAGPYAGRRAVVVQAGTTPNMWVVGFVARAVTHEDNKVYGYENGDPVVAFFHWNQFAPLVTTPTVPLSPLVDQG